MTLKRRDFIANSLGVSLSTWLAGNTAMGTMLSSAKAPAVIKRDRRPNVLLVLTDQERYWDLLPADLPLTARHKLQQQSTYFTQYHVHTAPCSPSRSNIYTGQHIQHTQVLNNVLPLVTSELSSKTLTLGHMLRENGYYTAYKGKWHLSFGAMAYDKKTDKNYSNALEPYGFSDYSVQGDHQGSAQEGYLHDYVTAAEAREWLLRKAPQLNAEQPWLLAVNFVNPHDIMFYASSPEQIQTMGIPSHVAEKFNLKLEAAPHVYPYSTDWQAPLPTSFYQENSAKKPYAHQHFNNIVELALGKIPLSQEELWLRHQNYYFNCITDVDTHINTVLNALSASGLEDNTMVIFTSDHGEMSGAHQLREKGPLIYRENIHVPLLIKHPDIKSNQTTTNLASAIDLVPTILALTGMNAKRQQERYPQLKGTDLSHNLEYPSYASERSRRGILFNNSSPMFSNDLEFSQKFFAVLTAGMQKDVPAVLHELFKAPYLPSFVVRSFLRGVYDGRYKFARYFNPKEHHTPTDWSTLIKYNDLELYDTLNDPEELHNLAYKPDACKDLILSLNQQLNALVAIEIGQEFDQGGYLPGPTDYWRL